MKYVPPASGTRPMPMKPGTKLARRRRCGCRTRTRTRAPRPRTRRSPRRSPASRARGSRGRSGGTSRAARRRRPPPRRTPSGPAPRRSPCRRRSRPPRAPRGRAPPSAPRRSAVCSARLNALNTSGRLSVIVCTAPSRVTSTSAMRGPYFPLKSGGRFSTNAVQPLARVLGRAREIERAALELDAGGERRLERLVDRLLREPHGDRPLRRDLRRDALRLGRATPPSRRRVRRDRSRAPRARRACGR